MFLCAVYREVVVRGVADEAFTGVTWSARLKTQRKPFVLISHNKDLHRHTRNNKDVGGWETNNLKKADRAQTVIDSHFRWCFIWVPRNCDLSPHFHSESLLLLELLFLQYRASEIKTLAETKLNRAVMHSFGFILTKGLKVKDL